MGTELENPAKNSADKILAETDGILESTNIDYILSDRK